MMREIKFRAWLDNEMYYFDLTNGNRLNVEWIAKNGEIMQYTGLNSKSRVNIYEGDILERYGEVSDLQHFYWTEQEMGLITKDEVVGNIYENPEIIKE